MQTLKDPQEQTFLLGLEKREQRVLVAETVAGYAGAAEAACKEDTAAGNWGHKSGKEEEEAGERNEGIAERIETDAEVRNALSPEHWRRNAAAATAVEEVVRLMRKQRRRRRRLVGEDGGGDWFGLWWSLSSPLGLTLA